MKKATLYFTLSFVTIVLIAQIASAECPDGKVPITIVTPSGKTKILCINDNAVHGIENAADNSATTVVPASCPKGCWTPTEVEYWSLKGELTCYWSNREQLECLNVPIAGEKTVFQLTIYPKEGVTECSFIDSPDITRIGDEEEVDACIALLEPYIDSTCPCQDAYREVLSQPTDKLGCSDSPENLEVLAGSRDMFSSYPGTYNSVGKQTCGIDSTSLEDITDDQAQSCIDLLSSFISDNDLVCISRTAN